jgi:hypothetical protein
LDGDTLQFSFLEGALAGGMLMGVILVGIINIQKKRGRFAMTGIGIMGIFYLLLSQVNIFWQGIVVLFFIGLSLAASNIPIMSVIQSLVEKEMIGRLMSLISTCSMGLIPVSYALTSLLLSIGFSISMIMLMGAVPLLLLVLYVFMKVPVLLSID